MDATAPAPTNCGSTTRPAAVAMPSFVEAGRAASCDRHGGGAKVEGEGHSGLQVCSVADFSSGWSARTRGIGRNAAQCVQIFSWPAFVSRRTADTCRGRQAIIAAVLPDGMIEMGSEHANMQVKLGGRCSRQFPDRDRFGREYLKLENNGGGGKQYQLCGGVVAM